MICIFKNDKVWTNIRKHRNPCNLFIFENDIYLFFKNDKVWTSATLATLATYLSLKMICIFKKMTKSERIRKHRNPCNLLIFENDIYLFFKYDKVWTTATLATLRNLFIFENDMYL